jgi:hypothetical protein
MYEPKLADRVTVAREGKVVKGRIAFINQKLSRVGVTFAKGEAPTIYQLVDVFPLYRYVTSLAPELAGTGHQLIQPLFF